MKVKLLYYYHNELKERFVSIEDIVQMIRNGKYRKSINIMQEDVNICHTLGNTARVDSANSIPVIKWGQGENGYTGLILLTLPFDTDEQLTKMRQMVNSYYQVVCSFLGSSGRTLKVVMQTVTLPDSGKNVSVLQGEDLKLFHANAYYRASAFLQANTGVWSTGSGCTEEGGCRMSFDEDVHINENVVPLIMDIPTSMPSQMPINETVIDALIPEKGILPGYSRQEMEVVNFNLVRRNVDNMIAKGQAEYVITLAEHCAKAGIDEEIAVKCTLSMNCFMDKDMLVRTSFERAYEETKPHRKQLLSKSMTHIALLQRFLGKRYRFRQNEVTGSVEFAEICKYASSWKPFGERERNTICQEALKAGIEVWDKDIIRYTNSTYVNTFDPIVDWLNQLPRWDGKDRVGELASTVAVDWNFWPDFFRLWMRSMVSQWKGNNRQYGASMVLMLTGAQGTGKSTFCKNILPPELSAYYVDRLDFTNKKDAERALIRFCLINLDEYDQISSRQVAFLKHILQKSDVSYRKMYENDIEQRRRYAAFCATTNNDTPLTDPTGSRRYLVVEVTKPIDNDYEIDYPQLYAQIVDEIRHGQPTYFDREQERQIQEHNANYSEDIPLGTMFDRMFEVSKSRTSCEILSSTDILIRLKERFKSGIIINQSTVSKLGKYLSSKGIHSAVIKGKRAYRLVEKK